MAIVRALKSGNWSDTTVWSTGALPTSADDVYSNTFTVTIDTDVSAISLRNGSATGVTAGGSFTVTSGNRIIAASIFASSALCLTVDTPLGVTIVGNVTGGTAANVYCILHKNGALTVNGNITTGSASNAYGIEVQGNAIYLDVYGSCTAGPGAAIVNRTTATVYLQNGTYAGGSAANQGCIYNSAGGSVYVFSGACVAGSGSAAHTIVNSGSGYVEINTPSVNYTGSGGYILNNSGSGLARLYAASLAGGTATGNHGAANSGTASLYVYANCNGGSGSNAHAVSNAGSGSVRIEGNCTGAGGRALDTSSTGISEIAGTCTGGSSANSHCIVNGGGGTVNISGNCIAGTGSNAIAAYNVANGNINITGSCTASGGDAVYNSSTGSISITGACYGGSTANRHGVNNVSSGTVSISGTCGGGTGNPSYGAYNASTGRINITGLLIGNSTSATSFGAYNASTGTIEHLGTITASSVAAGISGVSGGTLLLTGPFISASNGCQPVLAARWQWSPSLGYSTFYENYGSNSSVKRLYPVESFSAGTPATSNVRSGTTYGPSNELTGTLAVPPVGSVLLGVPVDNTTGTATITAANIRSALGMSSANLDTQLSTINTNVLSRLASADYTAPPTAASIASQVRTELATELARLDAAISTRLATSSYTAPPTAAAIATAVNSALDRTGFSLTTAERQAIATAVEQSILNENDGQAILNAIVGAIGNQNIDQVALVAAIRADLERIGGTLATRSTLTAAHIRQELAPELGNLDATVSSRLAASGYTAPPSVESIATAIWSNATRTLTTAIDNSSTIAAAVWSAVTRTLTANPGPTAADNATAVRQELNTELNRIDASISSRIKPADTLARVTLVDTVTSLTNTPDVPTETEIAEAVRDELAPELNRLSNAATTQEIGDIIESALQAPPEP